MWYFKKKDILEHFGKDGKDVRRLDRAIKRWQVIHTNGMYISRRDYDLQRLVKLKGEVKELKEKAEWGDETLVRGLKEDLEYQISENEKQKADYEKELEGVIDRCYDHMLKSRCLPCQTRKQ